MIIYMDSSALIKFFVTEPGSLEIRQFMVERMAEGKHSFVTAAITKSEVMAGLATASLQRAQILATGNKNKRCLRRFSCLNFLQSQSLFLP